MASTADILAELGTRWSTGELAAEQIAALVDEAGEALAGPHREDLLLAWACLGGASPALAALETTAFGPAGVHARSSGFPTELVEDALQVARMRLLVTEDDRPPALRGYRGRGSLAAFVRTVVLRIAIDLQRRVRETPSEAIEDLLVGSQRDPELEYMRQQYAGALGAALRTAWAKLAAHDRFILGLQVHHQLDLDAIANIYQVHRATAVRRAASARAALVTLTRETLRETLDIGDATVDSLLRIVTTSVAWLTLDADPL